MSDFDPAPQTDPPFAVWRIFRGLPRWYFARGCPPTIAQLTGWMRVLHVSVLLASMGFVATAMGLAVVWCLILADIGRPWHTVSVGFSVGGLLLFPLSRWIERPWWLAALAVPACIIWFGTLDGWWQIYLSLFPAGNWQRGLAGWAVMSTIGLGMGAWILSPRQSRSWLIPIAIVGVSAVATVLKELSELIPPQSLKSIPIATSLLVFLLTVQPIAIFIALTSAALGIRLWDSSRNRELESPMDWTTALAEIFAVWTLFRGISWWYFARGCPPTLWHAVLWVRALRATILLGTMGLVSSWVSSFWLFFERLLPFATPFGSEGSMVFSPGAWFGVLVLMPLSRWLGRGWIASGLLVPISIAVYFGAVHLYLRNAFNSDFLSNELLAGMACGLWGGFGVSLWFIRLRRPRTWWLVPWVAVVGGLVTWGMTVAPTPERPSLPFGLDWTMELIAMNLLFSPFQTAVAMALGARLWWNAPEAAHPSPRPAANTAETSTAKQGSSTDVAVSPCLNSP